MKNIIHSAYLILLSLLLVACHAEDKDSISTIEAAAIEASDQCHLCGMVIQNYPGPKGQLSLKDKESVYKFCSNRDAFTFYLQPENQHRTQAIFVHDMSKAPWDSPTNDHFIPAETAYYVYGSNRKAAMGTSLASFSTEKSAKLFALEFGGQMLNFSDISLDLLGQDAMTGNDDSMTHMNH